MKRKRFRARTAEEQAGQERRSDTAQPKPDCREERIEAEVAGKAPGAAGLAVRSKHREC